MRGGRGRGSLPPEFQASPSPAHLALRNSILDADIMLFSSPTDHYNRSAYPYTGSLEVGEGCGAKLNGGFQASKRRPLLLPGPRAHHFDLAQCFLNVPESRAFADTIVAMNRTWLRGAMDQDQFPEIADRLGTQALSHLAPSPDRQPRTRSGHTAQSTVFCPPSLALRRSAALPAGPRKVHGALRVEPPRHGADGQTRQLSRKVRARGVRGLHTSSHGDAPATAALSGTRSLS